MAKNFFLLAGRTGGPYFPLPRYISEFDDLNPVIVGVRGGFEEKAAKTNKLDFEALPEVKLSILSFKKQKLGELIRNWFNFFISWFILAFSLLKSIFLVLKYKPAMIVTTGSFLNAPMILAHQVVSFVGLTKTLIVVHQQDPQPGLANRFASKYADSLSCVFKYTKEKYPQFKNAELIPNPMLTTEYSHDTTSAIAKLQELNPDLAEFVISDIGKPMLFVFGGGSGALDINNWVDKNFDRLLGQFKIIHLIGMFQSQSFEHLKHSDYFACDYLLAEMPLILGLSDLVLARAGLATITELSFLQKPGYLAPLPHSHQEVNAKLVADHFVILDGKDRDSWLGEIERTYPLFFTKINYPEPAEVENKLQIYFDNLREKLDKNGK